jgi:glycosidase
LAALSQDGPGYTLRWINPIAFRRRPSIASTGFTTAARWAIGTIPIQSVIGQFYTLNDLKTELPEVRAALSDAFKKLVEQTDCDGFRVDTVRHVERDFWPSWLGVMREHAATLGKTNFLMFGEVAYSSDQLVGSFTTNNSFNSLLDFPLYYAIDRVIRGGAPTHQITERFQKLAEPTYGPSASFVTFIDNHDQPRFLASNKANGDTNKLTQALVLLYTLQGFPAFTTAPNKRSTAAEIRTTGKT